MYMYIYIYTYTHKTNIRNIVISLATDEGPSPKLALSEGMEVEEI